MCSSARLRLALFALLFTALVVPASALAAPTPQLRTIAQDGSSGRYLLAGDWYERADPPGGGEPAGLPASDSLVDWRPIAVPFAVNAGDFSVPSYTGSVNWYRADFVLPEAASDTTWQVRFESVNYLAAVWLNGQPLGSHAGAYLPFEFTAASIHPGLNHLIVRVDSRRGPTEFPPIAERANGGFEGGWWNYNGILREVYLRAVRKLDLEYAFARPSLPCRGCAANVAIDARVRNMTAGAERVRLTGSFGGHRLRFPARPVGGRGSVHLSARLRIAKPRLWEPGHPYLYRMKLHLLDQQGATVQAYEAHTGIRSIRVDRRGRIELNGRPVKLRGAAIHEDSLDRGAALSPAQMDETFKNLRDLGANITRTHYPLSPYELELADRYGIMVWAEVPVYRMHNEAFAVPDVRARGLQMLRDEVTRDYDHPSILVWSLGNENPSRPGSGFRRYIRNAARTVKRMDPTRLVGLAISGTPTVEKQRIYLRLDAIGINDYFGWYPGPGGSTASRRKLAGYLKHMHSQYPRQALMITEVGAEANRHGPATEKGTYEFQSTFLAYHLRVIASQPFVNAALIWNLHDFRVKPGWTGGDPLPHPPVNEKGLIDDTGFHKPAFYTVRGLFRRIRRP